MTKHTTLSHRGKELADGPSAREKFREILADPYDPDDNPNGMINIGVAENYAMFPDVQKYVNENVSFTKDCFGYGEGPWGGENLRKAMAKFMTKTFPSYKPVDPEDILFGNGVTSICEMLGFTIGDPGDGILLGRPIYQAFQVDFGQQAKLTPVFAEFGGVDQFGPESVEQYEEAFFRAEKEGIHVRVMMLCNPHNPLGQCYRKETIIEYMKFCAKYNIHLLCDEIYAASVYDVPDKHAVKFTSSLSFDHTTYISSDYVHTIYGLSKDFALGGARLGCIHIRNKELMRAMSSIDQFHWSGGPNQRIATTILEDEKWLTRFLELGRSRLRELNLLTRKMLDDAGINYHKGANAGFFLWIDLRPFLSKGTHLESGWQREEYLAEQLKEGKVFLTDGQSLSSEEPGWFRVIFSQDERVIEAGLKRLFKILGV